VNFHQFMDESWTNVPYQFLTISKVPSMIIRSEHKPQESHRPAGIESPRPYWFLVENLETRFGI
jgi:hypothetical protein